MTLAGAIVCAALGFGICTLVFIRRVRSLEDLLVEVIRLNARKMPVQPPDPED